MFPVELLEHICCDHTIYKSVSSVCKSWNKWTNEHKSQMMDKFVRVQTGTLQDFIANSIQGSVLYNRDDYVDSTYTIYTLPNGWFHHPTKPAVRLGEYFSWWMAGECWMESRMCRFSGKTYIQMGKTLLRNSLSQPITTYNPATLSSSVKYYLCGASHTIHSPTALCIDIADDVIISQEYKLGTAFKKQILYGDLTVVICSVTCTVRCTCTTTNHTKLTAPGIKIYFKDDKLIHRECKCNAPCDHFAVYVDFTKYNPKIEEIGAYLPFDISYHGTQKIKYKNGLIHSDYGPAVIDSEGEHYYRNNVLIYSVLTM